MYGNLALGLSEGRDDETAPSFGFVPTFPEEPSRLPKLVRFHLFAPPLLLAGLKLVGSVPVAGASNLTSSAGTLLG